MCEILSKLVFFSYSLPTEARLKQVGVKLMFLSDSFGVEDLFNGLLIEMEQVLLRPYHFLNPKKSMDSSFILQVKPRCRQGRHPEVNG